MKHFYFTIILVIMTGFSFVQNSFILPLWNDEIPNRIESNEKETQVNKDPGLFWIENVQKPAIEVFYRQKLMQTDKLY